MVCEISNMFDINDILILIIQNLLIIKDYIYTKETRKNVKNLFPSRRQKNIL